MASVANEKSSDEKTRWKKKARHNRLAVGSAGASADSFHSSTTWLIDSRLSLSTPVSRQLQWHCSEGGGRRDFESIALSRR